jgi:hypothetical protein
MALTEGKAWACLMTNVLVLPGAGTLAAGRRLAGLVQAILALLGFVLVCAWMVYWVGEIVRTSTLPAGLGPHAGLGLFGLFLAVLSWTWGLLSGLAILREAREGVSPAGR